MILAEPEEVAKVKRKLQLFDDDAARLNALSKALDEWRRNGRKPRRVSDDIWEGAIVLAGKYGVGPISRCLGLEHAKLKSKLLRAGGTRCLTPALTKAPEGATFVELLQGSSTSVFAPCVFQVESGRGARMQVEVTGLDVSGLSTLIREFGA